MRDNSLRIFSLDGVPIIEIDNPNFKARFSIGDAAERHPFLFSGVDFYAPNADLERLRRAAAAFNAIMREPIAQHEAAE